MGLAFISPLVGHPFALPSGAAGSIMGTRRDVLVEDDRQDLGQARLGGHEHGRRALAKL
jgi:hypothetical protein